MRVGNEIVKPMTSIFNLSLPTGIVPDKTKIEKVIPVCKKPMLNDVSSKMQEDLNMTKRSEN